MEQTQVRAVALAGIQDEPRTWPRFGLDEARVAEFMTLYEAEAADALPPIEVVPDGEGGYYLAEGRHRVAAADQLGWDELPALVLPLPAGADPVQVAFLRGLETAATAAKPLTRAERQAAIRRLLEERPELSDREIARLVGCAHTTVFRTRRASVALQQLDEEDGEPEDPGDHYLAETTAAEIARRLFRAMEQVRETRGLGLRDALFGDRMGSRLADVLHHAYEEQALERAQEFDDWLRQAIVELRER